METQQPEWFKRIMTPWTQDKIDWEKENFENITGWESNWDWDKGIRNVIFKLKDKSTKTFTSNF